MHSFGRHRKQFECDSYCWTCHRNDPDLSCTACVRSFHMSSTCLQCKGLSEEELAAWRCQECIHIEKGAELMKAKQIDAKQLKNVLVYNFDRLTADDKFTKPFKNIDSNIDYANRNVVNTMDLNTIEKKIEIGAYSCCDEFLSDIKWIVHNTKVHCSADYDTMKAAKSLNNYIREEMYTLAMCYDCYSTLDADWITKTCSIPHILVWAKTRTYPYWPAKMIRYNSDEKTVDVRYFGGEHLRAVVPVKDCLLYSKRNPSIVLGSHKKVINEAIKEAEEYIENLKKKYDSFYYANPITVLNGNFLERHLYEMIPKAWEELGRSDVPAPIPKPKAASATSARRMSLPTWKENERIVPSLPVFTSGRIMTRRMSAIMDVSLIVGSEEAKKVEPVKRTRIYRRQSIQVDRLSYDTTDSCSVSEVTRAKAPTKTIPKKRKLNEMDFELPPQKCANTANKSNDSIFKVPTIPKPRKALTSPKKSCLFVPTNEHGKNATDDRNPNKVLSPKSQTANKNQNSGQKTLEIPPPKPQPKHFQIKLTNMESSTNMVALHNAMVERNSDKIAETIQSSLSNAMFDCIDTTNPNDQSLLNQLEKQRTIYKQMIDGLRGQNHDLKASLKEFKDKYSLAKNNQSDDTNELQRKFNAMVVDLKNAQTENIELNGRLNSLTTKNTYLNATISKLQATNIEIANSLKNTEAKNSNLISVNKNLMEGNIKLNSSMENAIWENKRLTAQMKELQFKNEAAKNQAYEHYAKMINDIKKKQWCATCGMPGEQYFCTAQCEQYARNTYHSKN